MKKILGAIVVCFLGETLSAVEPQTDTFLEIDLSLHAESRYVSEGRDNLEGDGLASLEVTTDYRGLGFGLWAAESPDQDYTEVNYWLDYGYEWRAFTFSGAYTYLDFDSDDTDDHEYSFAITYALSGNLELAVAGSYSDASDGVFYELSCARTIELSDALTAVGFATLGLNDGYIEAGHDGWNHLTLGVELAYVLADDVTFGAFFAGNLELDANSARYAEDELLRDFVYGGLQLSVRY